MSDFLADTFECQRSVRSASDAVTIESPNSGSSPSSQVDATHAWHPFAGMQPILQSISSLRMTRL
jgi:hypothetical protein